MSGEPDVPDSDDGDVERPDDDMDDSRYEYPPGTHGTDAPEFRYTYGGLDGYKHAIYRSDNAREQYIASTIVVPLDP